MLLRKVVIATGNQGKLNEYRKILHGPELRVLGLEDVPVVMSEVIETGRSYVNNAIAKAVAIAKTTGIPAIGDDSGLEIDALNGAPGPVSARYGINLRQKNVRSERDRNELILDLMKSIPLPKRTARFRACVALAMPGNIIITREGICEGFIAESPRGDDGFGYDPIFLIPDGRSMAQIGDLKNTISHRGKAIAALLTAISSGKQTIDA